MSDKPVLDSLLIPREQAREARPWQPQPIREGSGTGTARTDAHSRFGGASAANERESLEAERGAAQVRQEAFQRGYEEGRQAAEQEALRLAALLRSTQAALEGLEHGVGDALIELAIDLARLVIRTELTLRREAMVPVVLEAMRSLPEGMTSGEIFLNPADVELIEELLGDALGAGKWRMVADLNVEPGGCRIATRSCDIDATLASRWRRAVTSMGRKDAWLKESTTDV